MYLINQDVEDYCIAHSDQQADYLDDLERVTHLKTLAPQMLSGRFMGRWLSMLSQMLSPKCIVEIGTFTGYATLCLAEGLPSDGEIHSFEVNDELEPIIREHWARAPFHEKMHLHMKAAEVAYPSLDLTPNLAFIDAGKLQYEEHFYMIFDTMASDGLILIDNVLWSGKVVDDVESMDEDTLAIHRFNQRIAHDDRLHVVMLPIRDGLTMVRRR